MAMPPKEIIDEDSGILVANHDYMLWQIFLNSPEFEEAAAEWARDNGWREPE
jgi:hypothetical protein